MAYAYAIAIAVAFVAVAVAAVNAAVAAVAVCEHCIFMNRGATVCHSPFVVCRLSFFSSRIINDLPCSTNTGLKGTQSHLKCTMPLFVVYLSHSMPFLWIFITQNQFYFPFSKLDDSCTQFLLSLSHSHAPSLSQSHTNKTQIKIFLRIIHAERPTSQNLYLSVFFVRCCCCCCFFFRGYKNFNMENIAENPKKNNQKHNWKYINISKCLRVLKNDKKTTTTTTISTTIMTTKKQKTKKKMQTH